MPDPSWDTRDALIDAYERAVERDIDLVFGRFLAGVSDDPRQIAFDVVLLDLMDLGLDRVIRQSPLRQRAEAITAMVPDPPEGRTTGLEDFSRRVQDLMKEEVRGVAQEVATLARQMSILGTASFKDGLAHLLDRLKSKLAEAFAQALLLWDRAVLDRVAELKDGEVLWQYAGPVDGRNRPFCSVVASAPRVYTRAAVERLNEHPLLAPYVPPNVFMLCGGYNCRHVFLPTDRAQAQASGFEVVE